MRARTRGPPDEIYLAYTGAVVARHSLSFLYYERPVVRTSEVGATRAVPVS
jgi:hypothetical protein